MNLQPFAVEQSSPCIVLLDAAMKCFGHVCQLCQTKITSMHAGLPGNTAYAHFCGISGAASTYHGRWILLCRIWLDDNTVST